MKREDTRWRERVSEEKPEIGPHLLRNHIYFYHPSVLAKICFGLFV